MLEFWTSSFFLGGSECILNVKGAADILGCGDSETDLVITVLPCIHQYHRNHESAVKVLSQGEPNGVQTRWFIFRCIVFPYIHFCDLKMAHSGRSGIQDSCVLMYPTTPWDASSSEGCKLWCRVWERTALVACTSFGTAVASTHTGKN